MLLLAALFLAQPAPTAPTQAADEPPPLMLTGPITAEPRCDDQPSGNDEVVVCGRQQGPAEDPNRLPPEFRSRPGQIDDQDASHAARTRDFNALERYSSQTVGPAGYMQRSREQDCQWRAARQEAQGRQIDCTVRGRRDSATDWQRQQGAR